MSHPPRTEHAIALANRVADLEHAVLDRASVIAMGRVAAVEQFAVDKARAALFDYVQSQLDSVRAALEKESARLDWLTAREELDIREGPDGATIGLLSRSGKLISEAGNLRAAIDAAMSEPSVAGSPHTK